MINDIEISNRLKGQRNNAQGKFFEHCIEAACETYCKSTRAIPSYEKRKGWKI